ncbi:MAG: hypothetical protein MUE40_21265, partial [Anaerolineae bacterium]|nr:hypothetical protein [Anaerolineae bacterium]
DEGEKNQIIKTLIDLMENRLDEADATDCSRLGWLYVNQGQFNRACEVASQGLKLDEDNEHCKNLIQKFCNI